MKACVDENAPMSSMNTGTWQCTPLFSVRHAGIEATQRFGQIDVALDSGGPRLDDLMQVHRVIELLYAGECPRTASVVAIPP
jgi:hypothetical protein